MIKQEKIDSFWKIIQPEFKPYLTKLVKEKSLPHPLVIDFDPTSSCNAACRFCIDADNLRGNYFSKSKMTQILRELAAMGTKAIVIVGGGEPLTYLYFKDLVTLAHKLNLRIGLVTNGLRLRKYIDIIATNCEWTRVSVDAATSSTYDFIHQPKEGNFKNLIKNIAELAKYKKSQLGFSFIVTNQNAGEIAAAAKLAAKIGCDFFELKTLINPKTKTISNLSIKNQKILFQQLKEIKSVNSKIKLVPTNSLFALLKKETDQPQAEKCYAKKLRAVITPDGVFPCANLRGNKKWFLGDPQKENFALIWKRNNELEINPSVNCPGYCARREFNVSLECLSLSESKGVPLSSYFTESKTQIKAGDKYFI